MSGIGRIAGIDYGTVRIGIAITDPGQTIASPYESYTRGDGLADARRFQRLVNEEQVVRFVVGLPVHTSGHESAKSIEARQFGAWLRKQTAIPVDFYDERYTSIEAEAALESAGLTSKRRKARRDMLAAQMILSAYLEARDRHDESIDSLDD